MLRALKVGTVVSIISSVETFNGLVVPIPAGQYASGHEPKGLVYVLITSAGEFQGKSYPFQNDHVEIISEPS
jgi:hypothetical protein